MKQQLPPVLFDTLSSAEMWLMSRLEPQDWPLAFRQKVEERVVLNAQADILPDFGSA